MTCFNLFTDGESDIIFFTGSFKNYLEISYNQLSSPMSRPLAYLIFDNGSLHFPTSLKLRLECIPVEGVTPMRDPDPDGQEEEWKMDGEN